jgi:predicted negative regulator of RcsB-dependent stress response
MRFRARARNAFRAAFGRRTYFQTKTHAPQGETIVAENVRLTRKELKGPDAVQTMTGQAVQWSRGHQQLVTAIGIGAAVVIAAIGVIGAYRSAQHRDANADLARAMAPLEANKFAEAATALTEVSTRWQGSQVAPLASLLAANSALLAGQADQAIAALNALDASGLPVYLQQQRLLVLGAALENKQQWADAATKYKDAAALSGPYTGDAIVGEARAQEHAGDAARAKELYRQAYDQFPELPGRDLLAAKFQS